MSKNIETKLETLEEYFSKKDEFYIPSYQRPYAWGVSQCEQLIEDIERHQRLFDEEHDDYFFGTILIAQEEGEAHDVALIDGQQRTTSFMLLFKALLLRLNDELALLSPDAPAVEDAQLYEKLSALKASLIRMIYRLTDDNAFYYRRHQYQITDGDIKYVNDSISELHKDDFYTILKTATFRELKPKEIKGRRKDNKYTNFYKNFRYFHNEFKDLTTIELKNFAHHIINHCQVITITSYNTEQAINIFNSLNGTGLPLTPIEVIVSQTTASSNDRATFKENWKEVVVKSSHSLLDLNALMTHYIFVKLSSNQGETRNPEIRAFYKTNRQLFADDVTFTADLHTILDKANDFFDTPLGQVIKQFNNNLKPFISSYRFYREDSAYLGYLLKLGALLSLSEFPYSNSRFKGFLEKMNLKYSQVGDISTDDLIEEIKEHIHANFKRDDVEQTLLESGVPNAIIYLNEYLFAKEHDLTFNIGDKLDIEHIMSQSGHNRESIMEDVGISNPDEFTDYAEKLGNKILLESNINRSISDSWFRSKKCHSIDDKAGYVDSRYPIAQSLVHYPKDTWTKEDIDLATQKAAKRITDFIFGKQK